MPKALEENTNTGTSFQKQKWRLSRKTVEISPGKEREKKPKTTNHFVLKISHNTPMNFRKKIFPYDARASALSLTPVAIVSLVNSQAFSWFRPNHRI